MPSAERGGPAGLILPPGLPQPGVQSLRPDPKPRSDPISAQNRKNPPLPTLLGSPKSDRLLGKIYWLTGLYVLPEYRSRMIAFRLMKRLLSLNQNLGASGYSRNAGRFLPKLGFQEAEPLPY